MRKMFRDDIVTAYEMSCEGKEKIIEEIRKALEDLGFAISAIVYGGFVKSEYFWDTDVGIFVSKGKPNLDEELEYAFKVDEA